MKQWGMLLLCGILWSGAQAQERLNKLTLILSGPAEFLVVDPQGRREGIDSTLNYGNAFDEISESYYGTGGVDSENPDLPGRVTTECEIGAAAPGAYRVQVTGTSAGMYRLDIYASNPASAGAQVSFVGVVTRHRTQTLRIDIDADTAGMLAVERVTTMQSLRRDIEDLYAAGLLGPERYVRELIKKVHAMERRISRGDSGKVYPELRKLRDAIERDYQKTLKEKHSGKRNRKVLVVSEDAFRILVKDIELIVGQVQDAGRGRGRREREDRKKEKSREHERDKRKQR